MNKSVYKFYIGGGSEYMIDMFVLIFYKHIHIYIYTVAGKKQLLNRLVAHLPRHESCFDAKRGIKSSWMESSGWKESSNWIGLTRRIKLTTALIYKDMNNISNY